MGFSNFIIEKTMIKLINKRIKRIKLVKKEMSGSASIKVA